MENNDIKVWLIADTHFGLKSDDEEWLNDYIGYFEDNVIPVMKQRVGKNDILIHCGDVFDNRATVGLNTLTRTVCLFEKFSEIFNDIRIVTGNHDIMKKSSNEICTLHALKYIPHVKVYFEPEADVIGGKVCFFNTWIEDPEREKDVLSKVNADYVFGHLMIGGSSMTDRKGVTSDVIGGVPAGAFKNAQVYAGHIHIRQDKKNIHYLGCPYHKDRGDIGNKKGVTILDIGTGKTEFIENTVSPQFVRESIYDIMNVTVGELKSRWKDRRVDLHMKATDMNQCNFDNLIACLNGYWREFNKIGDGKGDELDTSNSDIDFEDAKTSDEYMNEFIGKQDLDPVFLKRVEDKLEEYKDRI